MGRQGEKLPKPRALLLSVCVRLARVGRHRDGALERADLVHPHSLLDGLIEAGPIKVQNWGAINATVFEKAVPFFLRRLR